MIYRLLQVKEHHTKASLFSEEAFTCHEQRISARLLGRPRVLLRYHCRNYLRHSHILTPNKVNQDAYMGVYMSRSFQN